MDAAATKMFGKGTASLNKTELQKLLEAASQTEPENQKHYENLKHWSVGAYYSSEIGMRELGWTPNRVFPTYPACSHAESHA